MIKKLCLLLCLCASSYSMEYGFNLKKQYVTIYLKGETSPSQFLRFKPAFSSERPDPILEIKYYKQTTERHLTCLEKFLKNLDLTNIKEVRITKDQSFIAGKIKKPKTNNSIVNQIIERVKTFNLHSIKVNGKTLMTNNTSISTNDQEEDFSTSVDKESNYEQKTNAEDSSTASSNPSTMIINTSSDNSFENWSEKDFINSEPDNDAHNPENQNEEQSHEGSTESIDYSDEEDSQTSLGNNLGNQRNNSQEDNPDYYLGFGQFLLDLSKALKLFGFMPNIPEEKPTNN
jgi:hypothetical protein